MKYLRLVIVLISAGVLLTAVGSYDATAVTAQDKTTQTDTSKTSTTPTGFATGTTCAKTGIYRASNKYLEVIIVLEDGEVFPPFVDGEKTTWYVLEPSTKTSFEPIKVPPGSE